jgi:DNA-binding HxlR family transcriptional regulator
LLVLRELVFGTTRFEAFIEATGAPRNLVADRLRRLEDAGLVGRTAYQQRPVRFDYHLTDTGRRAAEVLLVASAHAHRRRGTYRQPTRARHHRPIDHEHELDVELVCRCCGEPASQGLRNPSGRGAP